MEKVRFGIIGIGNQGSMYAAHLFAGGRIENGVVTALCDINPAKIEAMKNRLLHLSMPGTLALTASPSTTSRSNAPPVKQYAYISPSVIIRLRLPAKTDAAGF